VGTNLTLQNRNVSGLGPSSGVLKARKRDVSETGSVSVLEGVGDTCSAGKHLRASPSASEGTLPDS
jgi:hypothetical protein